MSLALIRIFFFHSGRQNHRTTGLTPFHLPHKWQRGFNYRFSRTQNTRYLAYVGLSDICYHWSSSWSREVVMVSDRLGAVMFTPECFTQMHARKSFWMTSGLIMNVWQHGFSLDYLRGRGLRPNHHLSYEYRMLASSLHSTDKQIYKNVHMDTHAHNKQIYTIIFIINKMLVTYKLKRNSFTVVKICAKSWQNLHICKNLYSRK